MLTFTTLGNVFNENDIESEDEPDDSEEAIEELVNADKTFNTFIEVFHHPHSGKHTPTVIQLNSSVETIKFKSSNLPMKLSVNFTKPWAPFRSQVDFDFTEIAVTKCLDKAAVNTILAGLHGRWAKGIMLTLKDHKDVNVSLAAARQFGVRVCQLVFLLFCFY